MLQVSEIELKNRLAFDNPWWERGGSIDPEIDLWPRRAYFDSFIKLVSDLGVRRAVVLMGPRRVGKTVLCYQVIQQLIRKRTAKKNVFYVSVDNPVYTGIPLQKLVQLFQETCGHATRKKGLFVFFDEIQYLKDWEVHLKSLVDSYPGIKFIASGSAAAALRMKSQESGAGRFTDFLLPPLTFAEFLRFRNVEKELFGREEEGSVLFRDIERINEEFVSYINFGGFPEPVFSPTIRQDTRRFIGNDIIDKVLLRDLPSLYGIADSRELNQLFSVLAYNTGQEVSLDGLSKSSGVAKNTIKKYLEYLEAAFLIHRVFRVDIAARRFKRAVAFKVYLINPSLRAALFGALDKDDPMMGHLAETAVFAQVLQTGFFHLIHYARWKDGEVDWVGLSSEGKDKSWVGEIKWSDRPFTNHKSFPHVINFAKKNELNRVCIWTRTSCGDEIVDGIDVLFRPIAGFCYVIGCGVDADLKIGINPRTLMPYATK